MPIYALLDCNNFYASCERLFNPELNSKPIVVLSNNDGCIIARSNEAKALGIAMGEPFYKAKPIIERHNVHVFSSNYTLYGDMSRRVMATLANMVDSIEVYSIDEAFIDLSHHLRPEELARDIQRNVTQHTGIPVSIGIGPTKTLAKLANHIAKEYKSYEHVFAIDTPKRQEAVLRAMAIRYVWGIGRRLSKKLQALGVNTAYDLTQQSDSWIRNAMGVTGLRTVEELKGNACIQLQQNPPPKKGIIVSRSFGRRIYDKAAVKEALSYFTERAAEKLRLENQLVKSGYISLYRELSASGIPNYKDSAFIEFPYPTDSTLEIMRYVMKRFDELYLPTKGYKKCTVAFYKMISKRAFSQDLFDTRNHEKHQAIMATIDAVNQKMGAQTLQIATSKGNRKWVAKKDAKSPCYTTRWDELAKVS